MSNVFFCLRQDYAEMRGMLTNPTVPDRTRDLRKYQPPKNLVLVFIFLFFVFFGEGIPKLSWESNDFFCSFSANLASWMNVPETVKATKVVSDPQYCPGVTSDTSVALIFLSISTN